MGFIIIIIEEENFRKKIRVCFSSCAYHLIISTIFFLSKLTGVKVLFYFLFTMNDFGVCENL